VAVTRRSVVAIGCVILCLCAVACSTSRSEGAADCGDDVDAPAALDAGPGPSGDLTSPALDAGAPPPPMVCPPAPLASFTPSPYVPAVAHQGLCTDADIQAFLTACAGAGAGCAEWQSANVAGAAASGSPGTACGNCIEPPGNKGVIWVDPYDIGSPNYAACIQLADPIHGLACAAAYDNLSYCNDVACDHCIPANFSLDEYNTCTVAAEQGACRPYAVMLNSPTCAPDIAAGTLFARCTASGGQAPDYLTVATLLCGAAIADGGTD